MLRWHVCVWFLLQHTTIIIMYLFISIIHFFKCCFSFAFFPLGFYLFQFCSCSFCFVILFMCSRGCLNVCTHSYTYNVHVICFFVDKMGPFLSNFNKHTHSNRMNFVDSNNTEIKKIYTRIQCVLHAICCAPIAANGSFAHLL